MERRNLIKGVLAATVGGAVTSTGLDGAVGKDHIIPMRIYKPPAGYREKLGEATPEFETLEEQGPWTFNINRTRPCRFTELHGIGITTRQGHDTRLLGMNCLLLSRQVWFSLKAVPLAGGEEIPLLAHWNLNDNASRRQLSGHLQRHREQFLLPGSQEDKNFVEFVEGLRLEEPVDEPVTSIACTCKKCRPDWPDPPPNDIFGYRRQSDYHIMEVDSYWNPHEEDYILAG